MLRIRPLRGQASPSRSAAFRKKCALWVIWNRKPLRQWSISNRIEDNAAHQYGRFFVRRIQLRAVKLRAHIGAAKGGACIASSKHTDGGQK
jgi:hypothetical protein